MSTNNKSQTTHNQHIVPRSYLKLFAESNSKKNFIIGVKQRSYSNFISFKKSINSVACFPDYYEVPDKIINYWEDFFANKIEPYCTLRLPFLIQKILQLKSGDIALTSEEISDLCTFICVQSFRVPPWINESYILGHNSLEEEKSDIRSTLIPSLPEHLQAVAEETLSNTNYSDSSIKDIMLETLTNADKLKKYVQILSQKTWAAYINTTNIPFFTSDNPVVRYNMQAHSSSYSKNGLANNYSTLLFPLTPSILIQIAPTWMFGPNYERYDRRAFVIDNSDIGFIYTCNQMQKDQCYKQFFIPPKYFDILTH